MIKLPRHQGVRTGLPAASLALASRASLHEHSGTSPPTTDEPVRRIPERPCQDQWNGQHAHYEGKQHPRSDSVPKPGE